MSRRGSLGREANEQCAGEHRRREEDSSYGDGQLTSRGSSSADRQLATLKLHGPAPNEPGAPGRMYTYTSHQR